MKTTYRAWSLKGSCPICGKTLGRRKAKFCSQGCYTEHRNKNKVQNTDIRKCKGCEKEFSKPRNSAGIFCSTPCYTEWKKKNALERVQTCKNCGRDFKANKLEYDRNGHGYYRKFCSRKCYLEWCQKKKVISVCPVCGESFEQGSNHRKYCSQECFQKGRPLSEIPRTCRRALKKHHEDLKHDPERLTTKSMAKIIGCACPKVKGDA